MSEILEILMLASFGFSWPVNLIKALKSRSARGISVTFYYLILFGYAAGIISKLTNRTYMAAISSKWYVLAMYVVNFCVVLCNIIVYYRNKRLDGSRNTGA